MRKMFIRVTKSNWKEIQLVLFKRNYRWARNGQNLISWSDNYKAITITSGIMRLVAHNETLCDLLNCEVFELHYSELCPKASIF